MHILLLETQSYIGAAVAEQLQATGHHVSSLLQPQPTHSANLWQISNSELLPRQPLNALPQILQSIDGVVHTSFLPLFNQLHCRLKQQPNFFESERWLLTALGQALAGTNKPLIVTSDTSVLGDTGRAIADESHPTAPECNLTQRVELEQLALGLAQQQVRTVILRLPLYVYGRGGNPMIVMQFRAAQELGVAQYVAPGNFRVSAVHIDDLARLYELALESAAAGSLFHAATESGLTVQAIAAAVGGMLDCDVEPICFDEAVFNWNHPMAKLWAISNQTSAAKAIRQFGWRPQIERSLLTDLKSGSYQNLLGWCEPDPLMAGLGYQQQHNFAPVANSSQI